jgi:hypothetical protein
MEELPMSALHHLATWDQASMHERERIAQHITDTLAPRFRFQGLELCALGDQRHWIAMYTWRDIGFALLPGYHGSLGIDAEAVLALTRDAFLRCYPADNREHTLSNWLDYLRPRLSPVRKVSLPPLLFQRMATSLQVLTSIAGNARGHELHEGPTREEIVALAHADGFALASADEWEYACSGGARTLFRWGDTWLDASWGSRLRRERGFPPAIVDWQEDQRPNAFGLTIGCHPQQLEYCQEPGVVRGGDGGQASSGDPEFSFVEWLPFASAYRDTHKVSERWMRLYPFLRRVYRLTQDGDGA